jgi:phosphotransferase system enzyme I (PtsI)
MPSEDEQYEAYKKVLETYGDKPVIIRTLDIGGDKQLECMELPKEENPFLGLRALRLCFDMMPVFKTQLRALYRASVHGTLWIMFPMVGSIGDIRFAKQIVEEVKHELQIEGHEYSETVKLGIMVEIPSIAIMADIAASEVDFASIGTNDLCQYLTAVDRLNPKVAKYYQSYHPAMFRLIGNVVNAFQSQKKPVGICGELGGESLATAVLIGLGLRKLSMNSSSIASVKKTVSEINIRKAERMAQTVLGLSTAAQVESFLKSEMNEK